MPSDASSGAPVRPLRARRADPTVPERRPPAALDAALGPGRGRATRRALARVCPRRRRRRLLPHGPRPGLRAHRRHAAVGVQLRARAREAHGHHVHHDDGRDARHRVHHRDAALPHARRQWRRALSRRRVGPLGRVLHGPLVAARPSRRHAALPLARHQHAPAGAAPAAPSPAARLDTRRDGALRAAPQEHPAAARAQAGANSPPPPELPLCDLR